MAKSIKVKMFLEGAPEFNRALRECDKSLNELRSEMKLNSEQFKESQNSLDALRSKSEILNKQYEESSKKVEEYGKRLEELRKSRAEECDNLDKYKKALDEAKARLSEMTKDSSTSRKELKEQEKTVKELEEKYNKTTEAISWFDSKEVQLQTSLNNTTAEQLKYKRELDDTNKYMAEAENNADGLAKTIDEYGRKVSQADENTAKLVDSLEKLRENRAFEMINEGAKAVLETLVQCAETAESFEYAMAKVQSIARVSEDELGNMSDEIRRVSTEMGFSANEIAEATYQAISASVDSAHAIEFVEDATKLARAGFTETVTAVDVLTTAINAYGAEANTTAHIADDLITTQNLGKTTVDQLAQSIGTIIPTAAALGVSLDQLSAAYSILTRNGVNTAYATTYLRGMLNELANSGSGVADVLYEKTGYSFGELTKMGYTLGDVMQILGDSVDGNSESFNNLWSNVRASQGALNIFNTGAEEFNRVLGLMENNTGAVDEAFAIMGNTAVMTNERFEASVNNLKISIGESLSPAIQNLKESLISGVLEPFNEFIENNPELIQAITFITAGIATATSAVMAFGIAVNIVNAAFGNILPLLGAVIGGAGLGFVGVALASDTAANKVIKLSDELSKAHKSTMEAAEASRASTDRAKELTTQYESLASKTKLTDEELKTLNGVITELNTTIPGLNLAYRETNEIVGDNTEIVKANIEAMIAEQEAAANQETLVELYKERAEAEERLKEVTEELSEAKRDQAIADEQLKNGITEAYSYYEDATSRVNDLSQAQKDLQAIQDEANAKIDELTTNVVEYTEAQNENIESVRAAEEAEKAKEDAIEAANKAIDSQIGLLSEWSDKNAKTFGEMKEIWEGQNAGLSQYKDDLLRAKEILDGDFDPSIKNLTESMVKMDDASNLHNFIAGIDEAIEKGEGLEELADTWQEHLDLANEAKAIYAELELEQEGYADDSLTTLITSFEEKNAAQEEQNTFELETAEAQKEALTTVTNETLESMSDAITLQTETLLKPSIEKMCTTIDETSHQKLEIGEDGKSKVGERIGTKFIAGICKGIEDGSGPLGSAIQNSFERAIESVDMSGLVEKFNTKLGSMMGG